MGMCYLRNNHELKWFGVRDETWNGPQTFIKIIKQEIKLLIVPPNLLGISKKRYVADPQLVKPFSMCLVCLEAVVGL